MSTRQKEIREVQGIAGWVVSLLLCALLVFLGASNASAYNLLSNGGFEDGTLSDPILGPGWYEVLDTPGALSATTTNPYAGTYCMGSDPVDSYAGAGGYIMKADHTAAGPSPTPAELVAAGATHIRLAGQVDMSNLISGDANPVYLLIYIDQYDAGYAHRLNSTYALVWDTGGYQAFDNTVAIQSGVENVQMYVYIYKAGDATNYSGAVYVDDLVYEFVGAAPL